MAVISSACRWGWHRHMTLCLLLHFFLLRGKLALKKQPGLTLCQVAEFLEAVLASWHHRPRAATRAHGPPTGPRGPQCGRRPFQ